MFLSIRSTQLIQFISEYIYIYHKKTLGTYPHSKDGTQGKPDSIEVQGFVNISLTRIEPR